MVSSSRRALCFDDYIVDVASGRLLRAGAAVELRPKTFNVLHFLVVHAGRVVSKEEIFSALWPNVIVGDDSLVQCVGEIRQALGDAGQQLVRTVPRRGYMFTQPVREVPAAADCQSAPDQAQASPPSPWDGWLRRMTRRATLIPLAALVAIPAFWFGAKAFDRLTPASTPPLSIVVLPLASLNGSPDQEYFAEGLTEDLTTDLSRIPGSFVIGRSSAYSYQGKPRDVRQVGRELGVRYVLDGTVQRLDEQVRLTVHLIDAESGRELWAERFDGGGRDLVALQNRVTGTIARSLHLELLEAELQRGRRERPTHPDAHDLALQGWSLYERKTPQSVAAGRELLQRAVVLDPQSAFGWSVLSTTYTTDLLSRWLHFRGATREEWLRHAEETADKGYALAPNDLYAVGARAAVLQVQGRQQEALTLFEKQVALNRNYSPAWHRISYTYITLGQPEKAIAAGNEAIRLSPRDSGLFSFYVVMAAAYLHAGQDAQALEWARKTVQVRPDFGIGHSWEAAAAAQLGKMDEARNALAEFRRLQPGYTIARFRSDKISDNPAFVAQRERYYAGLSKAGLPD